MKALLIDIGNSRVKWALACANEQRFVASGAFAHVPATVFEEGLQQWRMFPQPDRVMLSTVVPDRGQAIQVWLARYGQQNIQRFVASAATHGVHNAYGQPETLGADRWAALIAAHALYKGDCLIADCGTALTLDFLRADGRHLGGYILPGLRLMRQALQQGTASLPAVAEIADLNPADDTAGGITHGALLAAVASLRDRMQAMPDATCLLTGGDATQLLPYLPRACHHDSHLVLRGLALACNMMITG